MTQLSLNQDANGHNIFALPISDTINSKALAASVEETITVPTGSRFVLFSGNNDFYVKSNATATIPIDISDGSAPELNPTMRSVKGGDVLHLVAPNANTLVTMSFYS